MSLLLADKRFTSASIETEMSMLTDFGVVDGLWGCVFWGFFYIGVCACQSVRVVVSE